MVTSPDILGQAVGRGAGVRRLNRRPLFIVGLMFCIILVGMSFAYQIRLADIRRRAGADRSPEPVGAIAVLKNAPSDGFIPPKEAPRVEAPVVVESPQPALPEIIPADPYAEAWARYREELERRRLAREQALLQAIHAPMQVQHNNGGGGPRLDSPAEAASASATGQLTSQYANEVLRQRALDRDYREEDRDINRAAEKRAFLGDRPPQSTSAHYLPGGRDAPLSAYEVKAGAVIPATMITGINSDLPGQIIGQVSENVYDGATGRFILIPQGAKLVGDYDNAVTTGQERVLVAWTRIIFPDSSSIDLGKMPGTDASGLAGFNAEVNTHFWKMFGSAMMLSVLSAGAQISQGGQDSGGSLNAQQSIAAGLGQQFGQLGQELARRNARIQPTLELAPGYRFTVMVTKDIALRPWISRRPVAGN